MHHSFIEEHEVNQGKVAALRTGVLQASGDVIIWLGNNIFSFLATYISCIRIKDSQTGMRVFRREMFDKLDVKAKGLEFETKMTVRAAKLGYKIVEIPIEYRERVGKSKLNPLKDGAKMLTALLSVAYSETSLLSKMILLPSLIFIPALPPNFIRDYGGGELSGTKFRSRVGGIVTIKSIFFNYLYIKL